MSKEQNLKSVFNEFCNHIDKIVGEYVHQYQPRISKHEERDGYLISLSAKCRRCPYTVIASISTTEDAWGKQLTHFFIQRAEFHAKSQHQIITDFTKIPKTPFKPNKGGARGS